MSAQKIKYLDDQERTQLLKTLSDRKSATRDYAIVNLFLNTGLRLSELHALNVGDVSEKKVLIVQNGKGGKSREIPMNSAIRNHLSEYLQTKKKNGEGINLEDPLFVSRRKLRLSRRPIQRLFKKWLGSAGL